jgi:hypothetical protein
MSEAHVKLHISPLGVLLSLPCICQTAYLFDKEKQQLQPRLTFMVIGTRLYATADNVFV